MAAIFSPNKTSARMLVDYAHKRWHATADADRLAMICDLFIKARSYGLLNKVAFFVALMFGLAVLIWPSVAVITGDIGYSREFFKSAIVQTTVTGVAALAYGIYSHYKRQQLAVENLMRYVLFSGDPVPTMFERVSRQLMRVDAGFNFGEEATKKPTQAAEE